MNASRVGAGAPTDPGAVLVSQPSLVTVHFLRRAIRRRWMVCAVAAFAGALLGVGWSVHSQATTTASLTMLLAHDPTADPSTAMATDVSLLDTRAVARDAVERMGLDMTSADFRGSVTAVPLTSQLLQVKVSAPDSEAAIRRADALADVYLDFRSAQLMKQARAVVSGYQLRVQDLQQGKEAFDSQYAALLRGGPEDETARSDALTQSARLSDQVFLLQQRIEETSLNAGAVVAASNVVDRAHVEPRSPIGVWALPVVSGLIAGLGLGVGLVLVFALTSDRLRRRDEIALALGRPVLASVGRLDGLRSRLFGRRARLRELARVEQVLKPLVDNGDRPARLALVAVGNVGDAAEVAAAVVRGCTARGEDVIAVDLTRSGVLRRLGRPGRTVPASGVLPHGAVQVVRPADAVPSSPPPFPFRRVHRHTSSSARVPKTQPQVTVVLTELDLRVGLEDASTWGRDAVVIVRAGHASAEELRTLIELSRAAGIRLHGAVLTAVDVTDTSSGLLPEDASVSGGVERAR